MVTPFECWNACLPIFDQDGDPYFAFDYGTNTSELITCYQLSGRVTEIYTECDWYLYMDGNFYDVPDVSEDVILEAVSSIEEKFGYRYHIFSVSAHHPLQGDVEIPIGHWINLRNGLVEMYHPKRGMSTLAQMQSSSGSERAFVGQDAITVQVDSGGNARSGKVSNILSNAANVSTLVGFILGFGD